MASTKLNLGAGTDIRPGWVNLDSAAISGIDVVHDIENLPLPFDNASCSEIVAQDVLEHVDYVPVLRDLHRILAPGGTLTIRVPHFTSRNNFVDPTHRRLFSINTFDFFARTPRVKKLEVRDYYFAFAFGELRSTRITFERSSRIFFLNRFVESWVNRSVRNQITYECTGL